MAMQDRMATWQANWLEDEEEQDSDTDSKLSGSAAADSVMRHLTRSRLPYKQGGNEFSLHPMKEQDEEEVDVGETSIHHHESNLLVTSVPTSSGLTNGYHNYHHHHRQDIGGGSSSPHQPRHHSIGNRSPQQQGLHQDRSPQAQRRHFGNGLYPHDVNRSPQRLSSPKFQQRTNYENVPVGPGGGYLYPNRKKDLLSPVPEKTSGGARVVEISMPPLTQYNLSRSRGVGSGGPGTRSMENVSQGTPPRRRRATYDQQLSNGRLHYRDVWIPNTNGLSPAHSWSHELLPQGEFGERVGMVYDDPMGDDPFNDAKIGGYQMHYPYRRSSLDGRPTGEGSLKAPVIAGHSHSYSGGVRVPNQTTQYRSVTIGSGNVVPNHPSSYSHSKGASSMTPPQRRANYYNISRDHTHQNILQDPSSSSPSHSATGQRTGEPNLQDVVQFLRSGDKTLVSNAASYLQHLAYGDDAMKTRIREHGAIPVLVSLIRHLDTKVQITALGALKNLSYGRVTDENKHVIASDQGLTEIMMALRNSRVAEVRELLTALLWNLSSCEELKLKLMKACLHDLVEMVIVTYTCWNTEDAREPASRPQAISWNTELKNTTGALRNVSSAGESARSFMRNTNGMVDTLLWLLKAGVQQKSAADEKTVENTACILRNLSYRLENEVDPQEGGEDVLDREWEQEQRQEMDEVQQSFTKTSSGCLAFCMPHRVHNKAPRLPLNSISQPICKVDFVYPDASVMPRRRKPVYGKSLLWQPEVAFVYLAVTEQYPDCADAVEAAAGAIQNLTACNWKWSVYIRNIIRTSNGLHLLAELLNNGHDAVVRASATAIRNMAVDQRNRIVLGHQVISNIIPRLPLGTNHLGISEDTSVALLCCLMELFCDSPENAKLFHEKEGILLVTRLTRSRQHTAKVTFAANKVCSLLWEYKECKSALKKVGWEITHYVQMAKDIKFDFETQGSISRDYQGSRRKKHSSKRGSSKKSGSKKKDKNEIGFIAKGPPSGEMAEVSQNITSTSSMDVITSPSSTLTSSQFSQIPQEPNYQTIPAAAVTTAVPAAVPLPTESPRHAPSPIEPSYQSLPTSPSTLPQGPIIVYQSIDDPGLKTEVQNSKTDISTSTTSTGGPLSQKTDIATSTTSTNAPISQKTDIAISTISTSGPLSQTDIPISTISTSGPLSQNEEIEPDPNATYACVDIEKKRASRRVKEQQKEQQQKERVLECVDSWV